MRRVNNSTRCPKCNHQLDDDDGVFFDEDSATKECDECGLVIKYTKKFEYEADNPYCKYPWNKTIMEWEE